MAQPSQRAGTGADAGLAASAPPRTPRRLVDTTRLDTRSPDYRRFQAFVDSALAGEPDYGYSASDAALLFLLNGQPRYCTLAVRTADAQVAAADAAILAGEAPPIAGDSYLHVGPMIEDVALTYQACAAFVDGARRARWEAYADQAIWNIWNFERARWGRLERPWSGWSVDNPGNNYHFSFLQATMAWALVADRGDWLQDLRARRLPALQAYFAALPGGGSREGTGYGTAQMVLFSNYRMWRDATGDDLAAASPHVADTIRYWVHATVPTGDRFAPIGDQARSSIPELYDYHRRLVLEARELARDEEARGMASWWLHRIALRDMRSAFNTRHALLPSGDGGAPPPTLLYHAAGAGHLFARTGWDPAAMWVAVVAGPFDESHAHQEQGGFTLFARDWLAVTENIWTHGGIEQQTPVHNVLRFEHLGKVVAQDARAPPSLVVAPGTAHGDFSATADLSAIHGAGSGIDHWQRHFDFAGRRLLVRDRFDLQPGTTATFQVNVPARPTVHGSEVRAGRLLLRVVEPVSPVITILDWTSVDADEYRGGWRIDIAGGTSGYEVELRER